jgi:hypothetical protein
MGGVMAVEQPNRLVQIADYRRHDGNITVDSTITKSNQNVTAGRRSILDRDLPLINFMSSEVLARGVVCCWGRRWEGGVCMPRQIGLRLSLGSGVIYGDRGKGRNLPRRQRSNAVPLDGQ